MRLQRDLFSVCQEEGSAAPGKQRYKTASKKTELANKHKVTCIGDDKLDETECVRRGQTEKNSKELTCNKAERETRSTRIQ